jgi:hypothetical protein
MKAGVEQDRHNELVKFLPLAIDLFCERPLWVGIGHVTIRPIAVLRCSAGPGASAQR